ncbi:MAG: hypothetical protein ACP5TE_11595 [Verrucomicrobiia bacterium]
MAKALFLLIAFLLPVILTGADNVSISDKDIEKARKIYFSKCAKCHKFYEPKDYTDEEWDKWMKSMARKSKLKPDQVEILSRFLKEYRKGTIPIK